MSILHEFTLQTKAEGRWIKDVYAPTYVLPDASFIKIENAKQEAQLH